MAYMRRIGSYAAAFPGERTEPKSEYREDLRDYDVSAVSGVTFPGSKRTGMPGAAIQRRAMALADVTGREVHMTRGEHYAQAYGNGGAPVWFVTPGDYRTDGKGRGWEVTVSEPDGTGMYRHNRNHFRTWPAVLAFMREHFPA